MHLGTYDRTMLREDKMKILREKNLQDYVKGGDKWRGKRIKKEK